jgi:hypothetical protein
MDGHETDPLSDELLDRVIHSTLIAEPAPDFVARVRRQMAREQVSSWGVRVLVPMAAFAVALVVAIAVTVRQPHTPVLTNPAPLAAGVRPAVDRSLPPMTPVTKVRQPSNAAQDSHRSRVGARRTPPLEVIILPDEGRALRQLTADITAGKYELAFEEPTNLVSTDITISPISIAPLDQRQAADEGVRQ